MTALLALAAGAIPGSFVFGFLFGRASADEAIRKAKADRNLAFQDSIEAWAETARAVTETEHWKSVVATPVALRSVHA